MTIYVSLELSLGVCIEVGDLRKKIQNVQPEKKGGSDPASFQGDCKKVITIVEDFFK